MKINSTITDFPLTTSLETLFREYKKAGVDAAELILGIKSRVMLKQIKKISKKYDLPIVSLHQPAWSFIGVYFDEEFVKYAIDLGVKYLVIHPMMFYGFESKQTKKYLEHLANMQEKYQVHLMLENMPNDFTYAKLHQFPGNTLPAHMQKITDIADEYGFLLTYDVSHAEFTHPQNEKIFQEMLPHIGNIHLSSFRPHDHHLPLNMGELDSKGLLTYLHEKKYKGLITLEVYYPRWAIKTQQSQFKAIADSVKVFRKITDKWS